MLLKSDIDRAIENAVAFLRDETEPHALLFMNILYRRCGIEAFADTLARYDAVIQEHPDRAPVLRVMRRVADATNPLVTEDWAHVTIPTDRMLVTGLYCDRLGVPDFYGEVLENAVNQGGYAATHALLSWLWIVENGCDKSLPAGFLPAGYPQKIYSTVANIINSSPGMLNDLMLEAGAFLCLARRQDLVDLRFVRRVFDMQNADGGWGPETGSNWHSSILGLMIITHVRMN